MKKVPYREAVGKLQYISQGTRPDVTFAVNSVSRYLNNLGREHWLAVKRIFRYLKGTSGMKLEFNRKQDEGLLATVMQIGEMRATLVVLLREAFFGFRVDLYHGKVKNKILWLYQQWRPNIWRYPQHVRKQCGFEH